MQPKFIRDLIRLMNFGTFLDREKGAGKKLGYYEIEIDNSSFVTLAVNPKEYFEIFKIK